MEKRRLGRRPEAVGILLLMTVLAACSGSSQDQPSSPVGPPLPTNEATATPTAVSGNQRMEQFNNMAAAIIKLLNAAKETAPNSIYGRQDGSTDELVVRVPTTDGHTVDLGVIYKPNGPTNDPTVANVSDIVVNTGFDGNPLSQLEISHDQNLHLNTACTAGGNILIENGSEQVIINEEGSNNLAAASAILQQDLTYTTRVLKSFQQDPTFGPIQPVDACLASYGSNQ